MSKSVSKHLKYPRVDGLPNSLLKAAAPIGASIIISSGDAILDGLSSFFSQLLKRFGILKLETLKPTNPILGFAPLPVAPSSRISPPDPVEAPGYGEIAVGWLWVSTLIVEFKLSSLNSYSLDSFKFNLSTFDPSIIAALSL